ncbi:uncharacterized protein FN964_016069 [Alca torda]
MPLPEGKVPVEAPAAERDGARDPHRLAGQLCSAPRIRSGDVDERSPAAPPRFPCAVPNGRDERAQPGVASGREAGSPGFPAPGRPVKDGSSPPRSHVYNLHEKSHGCAPGPCTDMHSTVRGCTKVFAKAAMASGSLNSPLSRPVLLG